MGGQRTRNFVRGPGFYGTGRGGIKQFTSFADFNLCGPSFNASTGCKAGYTTDSGVIKPHLQSFHSFSHHPKADIDEKISQVLIGTEPEPFQMDEFESDSDSDYDTESEEIVEHRNAITRSGRQIKASVRFDL